MFVWGHIAVSLLSAALLPTFSYVPTIVAYSATLGFMTGWIACGVGIWCAIRMRTRNCLWAGAVSLLPAILWGGLLLAMINGYVVPKT